MGKLQVAVTKKSLTKSSGTTNFFVITKKIDVQKRYSKLRFREDKGFNFCEQHLLVRRLSLTNPEQRFFFMSIINSICRMALTY